MPHPPLADILIRDCLPLAAMVATVILDEWRTVIRVILSPFLRLTSPLLSIQADIARLLSLLHFAFKTWGRGLYLRVHPPQHPFIIWRLHPIVAASDTKLDGHIRAPLRLWQDEFRLVPDRMAHYDLMYGIAFAATAASMGDYGIAVLSLLAIWLVIPITLQILVIIPEVYEPLDASVSTPLQNWFENLPSKTITFRAPQHERRKSWRILFRKNCVLFFEMVKHRCVSVVIPRILLRDPVYTQAASSPQGAFLALALASHFAPEPTEGNALTRGFLRFFLTYCTPVWSAYIGLVLMTLCYRNVSPQMTALAFAWASLALWFLLNSVIRYGNWLDAVSSPLTALRTLPYAPLWRTLPWPPPSLHIVRDRWVRLALTAITASGLALILAALQVLPQKQEQVETTQACDQCAPKRPSPPNNAILNASR